MKLLSVRIAEAPCKTKLNLPFETLVDIASQTGYSAICMRASAGGVGTPLARLKQMRSYVQALGLYVSMVTADINVPLNNEHGPDSLRNIEPSLDVAQALGCDLIRICMKRTEDIPPARTASQQAAARGIRLAHQCHTSSLFERVDRIMDVLDQIGQPNFGIIYEPANLLLCGESYQIDTLKKLRPHLMNVYVQNHRLTENGPESLPTFCRGQVRFEHLEPWTIGGVEFDTVCSGLNSIGYQGTFTIHQAQGITTPEHARDFARRCANYFLSR